MGEVLKRRVEAWRELRQAEVDASTAARLETLLELWLRYGRAMNLSGATSEGAFAEHVVDGLDCIVAAQRAGVEAEAAWLDVGSGGGFPGLVVAAASSHRLHLVEPRQKRVAFLELALNAIGRGSVTVTRGRIEGSTWDKKAVNETLGAENTEWMVASARAVFDPAGWLERGTNVVSEGGLVLVHVARGAIPPESGAERVKLESAHGVLVGYRVGGKRAALE